MKNHDITAIRFLAVILLTITFTNSYAKHINHLETPSKELAATCQVSSYYINALEGQSRLIGIDQTFPDSLAYFDEKVTGSYGEMRESVMNHVRSEVVSSLLSFNLDGFSPENIASFVAKATQPFLPFSFANGVKIIDVTYKGEAIIYKAEIPMHKNHNHAVLLTKAGIASATTTVCNDSALVADLLERKIVIQYDYYDSNGVFICSFNIKDSTQLADNHHN